MKEKYTPKKVMFNIIKIVGIMIITTVLSYMIDSSMLEQIPSSFLNRMSKSAGIESNEGKHQLIMGYNEESYKVGYMMEEFMTSNAKKAAVLGLFLGLAMVMIPALWEGCPNIEISVVILIIMLWAISKIMTEDLEYDLALIEGKELQESLEEEEKEIETVEERIERALENFDLFEIRELVREEGMDVNMIMERGCSPLAWAAEVHTFTTIPEDSENLLEVMDFLLEEGANPNCFFNGRSSLAMAVYNYDSEVVVKLINSNADVNIKNEPSQNQGKSPIHYAIENGDYGNTSFLIDYGADIFVDDGRGRIAYYQALNLTDGTGGDRDMVFEFIKQKRDELDINVQEKMDEEYGQGIMSELAFNVMYPDVEKIRVLLDDGMDINIIGPQNGDTLLHVAARNLKYDLCDFLLERGSNMVLRNDLNVTAREAIEYARGEHIRDEQEQLYELFDQYSGIENQQVTTRPEEHNSNRDHLNLGHLEYLVYSNDRYGFSVEYPDIFTHSWKSDNGDGIRLENSQADIELLVYGANNVMQETAKELYEVHLENVSKVLYKRQKDNWYVISWEDADQGFYEKTVVGEGSINTFRMGYPKKYDEAYSGVVEHVFNTFQTPDINIAH